MDKDNKTTPTKKSNDLLLIWVGIVKTIKNTYKKIIFAIYIFITIFAWCNRWKLYNMLPYKESFTFLNQFYMVLDILFILIIWVLLPMGLFVLFGKSFSIKIYEIHQNFKNNGFVNKKGQHPIVISSKKDKKVKNGKIYEFLNFGLDITEWSNRFSKLENWTDSYITYLDYAKHTKKIIEIHCIPTNYYEPFRISAEGNFVSKKFRHGLVVGCSGSGKTFAIKIIAYQFAKLNQFNKSKNVFLFLIDGKNDGYEEFEKTDNFYAGDTAIDGINYFYDKIFQYKLKHKEDKEFRKKTHILIIDEYAGILQDISNTQANELKNRISRMVKMGRSLKCFVWVGVQTAYKELFSSNSSSGGSSRESFTQIIALGSLDEQQKTMLFNLYKNKMLSEKDTGCGYCYTNGVGFGEIVVDRVEDLIGTTKTIRKALGEQIEDEEELNKFIEESLEKEE